MKRLLVLTLCLAVLPLIRVVAQSEVIDGIAAVVNNDVITYSQVREVIGVQERMLRDSYRGEELANRIKEMRLRALKDLIDRQLILQEFKKRELSIPDYAIEDRIQQIIRTEFGGDRSAFVRTLRAQGYTVARFKEITRDQIIVFEMKRANMKKDSVVSPAQVQAYYDKHKADYTTPEQIKLRMIVLREDDDAGGLPGGKQAMAEEIRAKLVSGADFGRMAQMYSEDSTTQEVDGDWGWIDRKTLSEALASKAFALRPGEISEVINIGSSYYIMMVEARKNASTKSISEVRDEIEQNLIRQEENKQLERWLDTLRQNAYIKIYS
jgi:Parvulin-like peptidyl-prolyl isomerase